KMKQFMAFVKKEFYHVLRDKRTLLILFGMPVMQILIFGFALTNEVKNARIIGLDQAKDAIWHRLISRIAASSYFEIAGTATNSQEIEQAFKTGEIKLAVVFPSGFDNDLYHSHKAQVQLIADASDPNYAATL